MQDTLGEDTKEESSAFGNADQKKKKKGIGQGGQAPTSADWLGPKRARSRSHVDLLLLGPLGRSKSESKIMSIYLFERVNSNNQLRRHL